MLQESNPTIEFAATLPPPARLSGTQWLVLVAAVFGWMFDGVEMGLFSMVGRPALQDLLGRAAVQEADIGRWIAYLTAWFLLGAACGGLLFGWLGDRIGRVRSMAISILAYSVFTGACYFAAEPWQLAGLRFMAALGMGGEWALGVALVVECWPERFRPILAGVIGAAGNVGYLLIAALVALFPVTPGHWRWTMLVCTTPALLALVVLAFLPESPRWRQSVRQSAARPLREIFTTRLLRPTLLAIGLASVALVGTWGCVHAFLPSWADQMAGRLTPPNPFAKGTTLVAVSIGAIIGGFVGPLIGGRIGRRKAYFGMCVASLAVCQFLFRGLNEYDDAFLLTAGLAGFCTASFYGWLPLYLPELFPTRVRATAQGLSYNFGRIFAAAGALGTGNLIRLFDGSYPRACATMSLVYLLGMVLVWLGPETKGKPLPE
ncbi:MAG TPA: MFS transporter [Pirellulales bacterium]|jgi:SHS family sialic acid transporter-like MFS transporter|nr:MFS transporter [Pirellulales bacterium]